MDIQGPAPRPCESCPYRVDAPSGVWAESEYLKLVAYDRETPLQPSRLFQCHQHGPDGRQLLRVCAGWAGVHGKQAGAFELMAVRLGLSMMRIDRSIAKSIWDYQSPVPLFSSGAEAAVHGIREIENPSEEARQIREKIVRLRRDIEFG